MTFVIQVLEPGKKRSKMYGGFGRLADRWIYAKQYTQPFEQVKAFADELAEQNPGYKCTVKDITGTGHDMYFWKGVTTP